METEKIFLETDSIFKLTGLHRILHKSKFQDKLHDLYSEFGAEWSNKVLDEIIDYHQRKGELDKVQTWQEWRILSKDRLEYQVIYQKLFSIQDYLDEKNIVLTHEQKMQDISIVTSPFVLDDVLLNEFLAELTQPFPWQKLG